LTILFELSTLSRRHVSVEDHQYCITYPI